MPVVPTSLLAVAIGLIVVLAYQTIAPVAPIQETAAHASKPVATSLVPPPYEPPSYEQFAIVNARPLFDSTRQPVAEPERTGTASSSPPALTLVGVAVGAGTSVALLKRTDSQASISGRPGQWIDGWQLVRIAPGFVTFRAGVTDYTLKIRAAAGLPQPPLNNGDVPAVTERPGP